MPTERQQKRIEYLQLKGAVTQEDMVDLALIHAVDLANDATVNAAIATERVRIAAIDLTKNLRGLRIRWTDQEIINEWNLEKQRTRP